MEQLEEIMEMAKQNVITISENDFSRAGAEVVSKLVQGQEGADAVMFSLTAIVVVGELKNKLFHAEEIKKGEQE